MNDDSGLRQISILSIYRESALSPIQEKICKKLDKIFLNYKSEKKYEFKNIFIGATFICHKNLRSNPEWIYQAAHSFREIMYIFKSNSDKGKQAFKKALEKSGYSINENIDNFYIFFSELAHHEYKKDKARNILGREIAEFNEIIFLEIVSAFEKFLYILLSKQTDIHIGIDEIIKAGAKSVDKDEINNLINANFDARRYFYSIATADWIDYLRDNEFFEVLKKDDKEINATPESFYLANVAKQKPKEVMNIILDTPLKKKANNIYLVSNFISAFDAMPTSIAKKMIDKITEENWITLSEYHVISSYEYAKILQKLLDDKCFKEIEKIIPTIFQIKKNKKESYREEYFYFQHHEVDNLLEIIQKIPPEHSKSIIIELEKIFNKILEDRKKSNAKKAKDSIYDFYDEIYLFYNDSIENLDVNADYNNAIKLLNTLKVLFVEYSDWIKKSKLKKFEEIFEEIFNILPNVRIRKRLEIYFYNKYPDDFKLEIKDIFYKIFEINEFGDLWFFEYEELLSKQFEKLNQQEKDEFLSKIKEKEWDKDKDNEYFRSCVITTIEQDKLEPRTQSRFARGVGGIGTAKYDEEELIQKEIKDVLDILNNEKFKPKNLGDATTSGMRDVMKNVITKQPKEYTEYASEFFDRKSFDSNYTYAFFVGIKEALSKDNELKIDWNKIILLIDKIAKSDKEKTFDLSDKTRNENSYQGVLYGWREVFKSVLDLLIDILQQDFEKISFDFSKNRKVLFEIIEHFTSHSDPLVKDEKEFTNNETPEKIKQLSSDPLHTAINSIRGRAFQCIFLFMYQDSKFKKDKKISDDIKKILEERLNNEKTLAIHFIYGQQIASLYYRDEEWTNSIINKILSKDNLRLFLASWEGYLSQNLYEEVFIKLREYYKYAISLKDSDYTKRAYFIDLDEGLAIHLALAFIYGFVELEDDLIKKFFARNNKKSSAKFIYFVGAHCVTKESFDFAKEEVDPKRLQALWEWRLKDKKVTTTELKEFGFWVDKYNKKVFPISWWSNMIKKTLKETKGDLSWDYALLDNFETLAQQSPKDAIEIFELLIRRKAEDKSDYFYFDKKYIPALKELYKNPDTKDKTLEIVNFLVEKGSWNAKEVLK